MSYDASVIVPKIQDRIVVKPLYCCPGPADLHQSVIDAMSKPIISPMCKEYWEVVKDILMGLKYIFQTNADFVLALSGSGHAGMEAVITNLVAPGETILIANRGMWDIRASIMAHRHGCKVEEIKVPIGQTFPLEQLEQAIKNTNPKALFITHGDSSTGTVQKLEGLGDICHKYGVLLLVDTVMSIAAVPFFMDKWGIDVMDYGGKGSYEKQNHLPPFYFDCIELAGNWNCFGETRTYHHTLSPPMIHALRACLQEICKETLEKAWERHSETQRYFIERLQELSFGIFVQKPEDRLATVTTITLPRQYDYLSFVEYIRAKHNIVIVPGLGPSAGKVLRIGLTGINSTIAVADRVAYALADTRKDLTKSLL